MKKHLTAWILASMLVAPMAVAQEKEVHRGNFGGLTMGRVSLDDIYTGNIGIVLGGIAENGFGFEFLYSLTVVDYEFDSGNGFGGSEYDSAEIDTVALFAIYKTPGDLYFKAKLGVGYINLTLDGEADGRESDSNTDLAYGIAGGIAIGDGALELSYNRFPNFDDFDGVKIDDDEVEMLNLTYLWTF